MSKATELMRELMDIVDDLPEITDCAIVQDDGNFQRLDENGKWIDGRFEKNIRIDQATHLLKGDLHGHVLGRNGQEYVVVNFNGTASHGMKGRLHKKDAEALMAYGFTIPANRIIEWSLLTDSRGLQPLFG